MACVPELFLARGKAIDRCKVMIYDAEVNPDAHAGSRGVGPGAKLKVGGHGDFYHDDVKTTKTSQSKGLYYIT